MQGASIDCAQDQARGGLSGIRVSGERPAGARSRQLADGASRESTRVVVGVVVVVVVVVAELNDVTGDGGQSSGTTSTASQTVSRCLDDPD